MPTESRGSASRRIRRLLNPFRGMRLGHDHQDQIDDPRSESPGDKLPEPPPLPFLPARRPSQLTPTPSRECVAALGTFTRLPPELRRQVLIAAFGNRTLHVDLELTHPQLTSGKPARDTGARYEHGYGAAPLSWFNVPDRTLPKTWRWWSCVCHSQLPPGSKWERKILARGPDPYRFPKHDNCINGTAMMCQLWGPWGPDQGRCGIGVMGWLLSCRQAYAETIDLLYSTNTFFIESLDLFDVLFCPGPRTDHLFLPERFSSISSLVLRWNVVLFGRPVSFNRRRRRRPCDADEDRTRLARHLRHLCEPFPNLRRLVLSFTEFLYCNSQVKPRHALGEIDHVLLQPLADALVRVPLPAQPVVVELPSGVFRGLCWGWKAQGLGLESGSKGADWDGDWLRYPITALPPSPPPDAPGDLAADSSGFSQQEGSSHCGRSGSDGPFYYYIKEGVETENYTV